MIQVLHGDCRDVLRTLPDESAHCVVTSPPYFGLRDYGHDRQIGLEPTPEAYIAEMVAVMREVRRILRSDGTLWLNIGDSYARDSSKGHHKPGDAGKQNYVIERGGGRIASAVNLKSESRGSSDGAVGRGDSAAVPNSGAGLKPKDLIGIPWMLAFALRADGWWLRQDIIWSKPNAMPESVTDRCTKAHEYLFLLTKSERYYFDAEAIAEAAECERLRGSGPMVQPGTGRNDTGSNGDYRLRRADSTNESRVPGASAHGGIHRAGTPRKPDTRNKRSVWTVATHALPEAHFATFPPALIEPCIKAGCPEGGTVLDPFGGAGTTGLVADRLKRGAILIELNPEYVAMAKGRIVGETPLFTVIA